MIMGTGKNSRDILSLLYTEAKRRPAIAEMMQQVHGMSDDEIAALKVPLPWYRKALKLVRDLKVDSETRTTLTASIIKQTHLVYLNDSGYGATRRWDHGDEFIEVSKSGTAIELKTGQFVWFPESGGVWIDTIFSPKIDPKLAHCTFVERNKRSDYQRMVVARRTNTLDVPNSPEPEQRSNWFRIERIG